LIDAGTTLGLVEIGKVRETHDYAEGGPFQPDLRAGVAINPDSELIPVARAGAITAMHVRPVGGIIAGQTSGAQLAGWTVPTCCWSTPPPCRSTTRRRRSAATDRRLAAVLKGPASTTAFAPPWRRRRRMPLAAVTFDPRYEALRPFMRGEKPVHIEADTRQQILEAVQFAQEESLKLVITGGADAWKVAAVLKERSIPVIVGPTLRQPVEEYDPFDAPYANPGRLWEAGVKFCIRSNNASNSRNAPFEAAIAVAYGLPEAEALKGVTLSSAEILGVADRLGSLTPGKQADLIITDGSPLLITSYPRCDHRRPAVRPESRQTKLAEKYRQRPNSPGR
jgi:imidazolonepropionase-like amidohydrolase